MPSSLRALHAAEQAKAQRNAKAIAAASRALENAVVAADKKLLGPVAGEVASVSRMQAQIETDAAALHKKSERLLGLAVNWRGALDSLRSEVQAVGDPGAWGAGVASDLDTAAADLERAGVALESV